MGTWFARASYVSCRVPKVWWRSRDLGVDPENVGRKTGFPRKPLLGLAKPARPFDFAQGRLWGTPQQKIKSPGSHPGLTCGTRCITQRQILYVSDSAMVRI